MFTLYLIMDKMRANNITRHFFSDYPNYTINFVISKDFPEKNTFPDFSLAVCDCDRNLLKARHAGIPSIAFSHENNRHESLMGTPWLILDPESITPFFLEKVYHRSFHLPLSVLESARCFLRELTMNDFPGLSVLQEENKDNPSGCFFPENCPDCKQFLSDYINHQYNFYDYGIYGIFLKNTEEFIGIAGFSPCENGQTQVGYSIQKRWQNQGFSSEILPPLLAFGKNELGLSHIVARIREDNIFSIRLARKCHLEILRSD